MRESSAVDPPESRRRRRSAYLIAACLYAVIAILFTYPQVRILSSGFAESPIGGSSDYNIVMWDAWWAKKALIDLRANPFHTSYLFYPNGTSLALHELTLLNSALTIPFQLFMHKPAGIILGCNVAILLTFVIAGMGMFGLVKYLVGDNTAAFFGGAAFAFCPYRTMHIVHTDLLSMGWIPLYLLFLLRTLREREIRYPVFGALVFGAAMLTCNVYTYFLILLTGFFLVYSLVFERGSLSDRLTLSRFLILFSLIGLMLLPRFVAILHSGAVIKQPERILDMLSANLVGYFLPADKHTFYRFIYGLLPETTYYLSGVPGHATFLTFTVLALASVGVIRKPIREIGFWLAIFLVFLVLSLGPSLHFWKWSVPVPLPYALFYEFMPFFGVMRTPYRFVVPAETGIIVIACYGLAYIGDKFAGRFKGKNDSNERPWLRSAAAVFFTLLVLLELWNIPFKKRIPPVPDVYRDIGGEEDGFAVMDLPTDSYSALTESMYYQTIHEKPIPGGILSRSDPELRGFMKSLPPKNTADPSALSKAEAERLRELRIKYVIYHRWDNGTDDIVAVLKLF